MFNSSGWVIASIVLTIVLILATRTGGNSRGREMRRLATEADRLVAESVFGDDDVAVGNLGRAIDLAKLAGDGLLASEAASHLGDIYMKRWRYADALSAYEQALAFKQNPGWYTEKPNFEALLQRGLDEARRKAGESGAPPH